MRGICLEFKFLNRLTKDQLHALCKKVESKPANNKKILAQITPVYPGCDLF